MRRAGRPPSWFGTLRRDRHLFALVGSLAILLGMLQPLAVARTAAFHELMVLCSQEPAPVELPRPEPGCPLCPMGHTCGAGGALQLLPQTAALPLAFPESEPLPAGHKARPKPQYGQPPPSIRAPPLSA